MQNNNTVPQHPAHVENATQYKTNNIWLVVLVALVLVMMLLSYPLFNYMWDPAAAQQTFSH
jgi:hypothetical protein